LTALSNYTITF